MNDTQQRNISFFFKIIVVGEKAYCNYGCSILSMYFNDSHCSNKASDHYVSITGEVKNVTSGGDLSIISYCPIPKLNR